MSVTATFYDHVLDAARQEKISMAEALAETRAMGFTLLETSFTNVQGRVREAGRELSAAGLGISAMPAFFNFGVDPDVEKQARPVIDVAKELDVPTLLVIPGFIQEDQGDPETQTLAMIDGVKRLEELAAQAGLGMTMEDFDGLAAPFSTSGGMLRFIEACPSLTATFDTGNFRFMAEDELSAYQALRRHIAHVHLKDRALAPQFGQDILHAVDGVDLYPCPVGAGSIRIPEILDLLKADGYQGIYTAEHYGADPMLECLRRSAQWLKEHLA